MQSKSDEPVEQEHSNQSEAAVWDREWKVSLFDMNIRVSGVEVSLDHLAQVRGEIPESGDGRGEYCGPTSGQPADTQLEKPD